jgi:hypothetical protein
MEKKGGREMLKKLVLIVALAALGAQAAEAGFLRFVGKQVVRVAKQVGKAVW